MKIIMYKFRPIIIGRQIFAPAFLAYDEVDKKYGIILADWELEPQEWIEPDENVTGFYKFGQWYITPMVPYETIPPILSSGKIYPYIANTVTETYQDLLCYYPTLDTGTMQSIKYVYDVTSDTLTMLNVTVPLSRIAHIYGWDVYGVWRQISGTMTANNSSSSKLYNRLDTSASYATGGIQGKLTKFCTGIMTISNYSAYIPYGLYEPIYTTDDHQQIEQTIYSGVDELIAMLNFQSGSHDPTRWSHSNTPDSVDWYGEYVYNGRFRIFFLSDIATAKEMKGTQFTPDEDYEKYNNAEGLRKEVACCVFSHAYTDVTLDKYGTQKSMAIYPPLFTSLAPMWGPETARNLEYIAKVPGYKYMLIKGSDMSNIATKTTIKNERFNDRYRYEKAMYIVTKEF